MTKKTVEIATGVSMALFQTIGGKVKVWFDSYGAKEMEEIEHIRNFYLECCWPQENQNLPTTLLPEFQDDEGENDNNNPDNRNYPIYFQMVDKQPVFHMKRFKTITHASTWERCLGQNSFLSSIIKDMIGHICNYQLERNKGVIRASDKGGIGGKGYSYDPTNLFFEEFKKWLVELSKAPLNETTLDVVEGRIRFLRAIDVHQIFKQSDRDVTRHKTVIRLLADLTDNIQPMITGTLAAEGAREHFQQLTINLDELIRDTAKFCFYLYRDTKDTPAAFVLKQLEEASLNFEETVANTQSGQLLYKLFNSPLVKLAKGKIITDNSSLPSLIFPEESLEMLGWDQNKNARKTGILNVFCNNAQIMNHFFKLHHLIEKLYTFRKIAFDLHHFSGEGGNLLVYGYAAPQLRRVLNLYKQLLNDLEITVNYLHRKADLHRRLLIDKNKSTKIELRWMRLFIHAEDAKNSLLDRHRGQIPKSAKLIRIIEDKIDVVNSPAYIKKLRKDVKLFTRWMVLFTGEEVSLLENNSPYGQLIRKKQVGLLKEPLALKEKKKKLFKVQIAHNRVTLKRKKLNRTADNLFHALGYTRDDAVKALVDVCESQPFVSYIRAEVINLYEGKQLPEIFDAFDKVDEYNNLIKAGSSEVEASMLLDELCLKTKGFISCYITYRYRQCNEGLWYSKETRGTLHALSNLNKHDLHIFVLDQDNKTLIPENTFKIHNPIQSPVFLLRNGHIDESNEIPCFDLLLDITQTSTYNMPHSFFEKDDAALFEKACELYDTSQSLGQRKDQHQSNLNTAVGCMDALIRRHPKNIDYLLFRGKCLASTLLQANRKLAVNDFTLALEYCKDNEPKQLTILYERGITYQYMHCIEEAIEDFGAILKIDPDNCDIRLLRGRLCIEQLLDYEKGISDYDYILEKKPEDVETLKARFRAHETSGNYELAKKDATTLLQLRPNDERIQLMLSEALKKAEQGGNAPKFDDADQKKCAVM